MWNGVDWLRTWRTLLRGEKPALSIELTKECPLRCPGCYAFSPGHVGEGVSLRELHDLRGPELVAGVMGLVQRYRPLHVSFVGGDPLVRYRELEELVPRVLATGAHVQVVTSAFRPLPEAWVDLERFQIVVSVDGLQPDHDARRAPATYARIRRHIAGHKVVIHCTATSAMDRAGYLESFVADWSAQPEVKKIWISLLTPQQGEDLAETPSAAARDRMIAELMFLREIYPRLEMPRGLLQQLAAPPASPRDCIFANTTRVVSADLKSIVGPCQLGGAPDCSRCGCYASMGLAAVANHRLPGGVRAGALFNVSAAVYAAVTGAEAKVRF